MMNRRSLVKWLHWISFGVIVWFYFVEPDENRADPGGALSTHAGMGVILALITLVWVGMYLRTGALGRPGPKLRGVARTAHPWLTKTLYLGLPLVVASGALAGLAAPYAILAFDILPINPPFGTKAVHDFAEEVHEIVFDGMVFLIVAHAAYHTWRHLRLRDNALRIMVPRVLHRYL